MLKKFLMLFSFFRKREIKKLREQLAAIKQDFTGGYFNNVYIVALHSILKSPVVSFKEELVHGSLDHIAVHSKTSMEALKSLNKLDHRLSDLTTSPSVSPNQKSKHFGDWYASEQTVTEFVLGMNYFLTKQVATFDSPLTPLGEQVIIVSMDEKEEHFLEGLLYRLLLVDVAFILDFYLESAYEKE
ncbi:hypothetical protein CF8_0220 [Aeromonas phage CF8]|nr:hypothetical protein CF8_0220 [Aeromonas phage CF8]